VRAEAALFVLVLLASSAAAAQVFPGPEGALHPAEQLLSLLEPSHDQVEAALQRLGGEEELPGAWDALWTGELAAAEALRLMDMGRYRDAMDAATEALRLYGDALRLALADQGSSTEAAGNVGEGLRDALGRAHAFLARVRSTVDKLGEDASEVHALLDEAEEHLMLAKALLDEGDVEGAEAEASAAEGLLDRAMELLRGVDGGRKAERAVKFLEKTEERLRGVEEKIAGNPLVLGTAVLGAAFKNAKALPNRIRALIQSGRLESAIDELDALEGLVDDADELVEQLLEEDDDEDETTEVTEEEPKVKEDKVKEDKIKEDEEDKAKEDEEDKFKDK
jgi:tetratricopeptide (TPR) repeat protein